MANLYDIKLIEANIFDQLENNGGEITPEIETALDNIGVKLEKKVDGIVKICSNFKSDIDGIDAEIARLKKNRQTKQNSYDGLLKYTKDTMVAVGTDKIASPTHKIKVVKNNPSVNIIDEKLVHAKYITIKTTNVINKDRISVDLKNDIEVEGCELITDKTHLRIT